MMIDCDTDDQIMYLGSANFYPPVLDPKANNLNVGIITRAEKYIAVPHVTFGYDWDAHESEELKLAD